MPSEAFVLGIDLGSLDTRPQPQSTAAGALTFFAAEPPQLRKRPLVNAHLTRASLISGYQRLFLVGFVFVIYN